VCGIRLARIDQRMLKLRNLVTLDLSNNEISKIPEDWKVMESLKEINLSHNHLEGISRGFCVGSLSKTLRLLNLSSNKLILLPNYFCSLNGLYTLVLSSNKMKALPPSIAKMTQLKHFDIGDNEIEALPGGFARLRLDSLEMTGNFFPTSVESRILRDRLQKVPSLLEIAARLIVCRGIKTTPEDLTPQMIAYLDSGMRCLCSAPVWNSVVSAIVVLELRRVCSTLSSDGLDSVPLEANLCSGECLQKFQNNPYAF